MESVLTRLNDLVTRMDQQNQKMDLQSGKIDDIAATMKELVEVKGRVEELEKGQERMNESVATLVRRCESLSSTVDELSGKIDELENRNRRNNLVLFGIDEKENESWADTEAMVREILQSLLGLGFTSEEIERAHRVGRPGAGSRPVVIRFLSFKHKLLVLDRCHLLKGTKLSVSEDFSRRVRDLRRSLVPLLKEAKRNGHRASLRYDRLFIDGEPFHGRPELSLGDVRKKRLPSAEAPLAPISKRPTGDQPPSGDVCMETGSAPSRSLAPIVRSHWTNSSPRCNAVRPTDPSIGTYQASGSVVQPANALVVNKDALSCEMPPTGTLHDQRYSGSGTLSAPNVRLARGGKIVNASTMVKGDGGGRGSRGRGRGQGGRRKNYGARVPYGIDQGSYALTRGADTYQDDDRITVAST